MKVYLTLGLITNILVLSSYVEASSKTISLPFIKTTLKQSTSTSLRKRASYGNPLYNMADTGYLASINVGTPPQTFNVIIDTGSADIWVPSIDCPERLCPTSRFFSNQSSTFKTIPENFDIGYAIGFANGTYATDTVSLGGASVNNQKLAIVYATDSVLPTSANLTSLDPSYVEGVLGLGYPNLTYAHNNHLGDYNPLIFNLAAQNIIDSPVFSIYLSSAQTGWTGEIILGGVDTSKYDGDIAYLQVAPIIGNLATTYRYWSVYAGGMGVASSTTQKQEWIATENSIFILDTGSTLSRLPSDIVTEALISMTGNQTLEIDNSTGAYLVDCTAGVNNDHVFQLKMLQSQNLQGSSIVLNIPFSQLILLNPVTYDNCIFGLVPSEEPFFSRNGQDAYIIGDTVLRSMYMVFDGLNNQIGVAPTKGSGSTITASA